MAQPKRRAKLVLKAQFNDQGQLKLNGKVTKAKDEMENLVLKDLEEILIGFLQSVFMKATEGKQDATSEGSELGLRDESQGTAVSEVLPPGVQS